MISFKFKPTIPILLQDTSEVKRKSVKRTFKTEKEFLEFTLSYQKVLSERDAGVLFSLITCSWMDLDNVLCI